MHDRDAFAAAMGSLAVNSRLELSEEQLALFWAMLGDLSDEDFARAVHTWINTSRYFPTIAELRQTITPYTNPHAEGTLAFDKVCDLGDYTPEGYRWRVTKIANVVGPVAAEAFLAAGGTRAFEQEQGEKNLTWLRKRFVEAYVAAFEAQRAGRQLAAAGQTRIPSGSPVQALVDATVRELAMPDSSR